jgi:hypothetical protein
MPGASWPTSLQKFQASKATLKPSLLIPGCPTAVSPLAPETPCTITFTRKNTTCKCVSMAIPIWVLCLGNRANRRYLYTSIGWGLSQQEKQRTLSGRKIVYGKQQASKYIC